MDEIEQKLDEDFLFYVGFTKSFWERITDENVKLKCQQWLKKLITTTYHGAHLKRCRNIYLSHLLIYMQSGSLDGPFLLAPREVDISNAIDIFQPIHKDIDAQVWMEEVDAIPPKVEDPKSGRTYIATRTLPDGQGAFAYIGISLAEEEPMWLGGGEGKFDAEMSRKWKQKMPPNYEMERILSRRKDPTERQKVLTFYDVLLQNIADEMDGFIGQEENETVNGLVDQLIVDLDDNGKYDMFLQMDEDRRRKELLLILHDRVRNRREKVAKREEYLDDIEQKIMPTSFFECSVLPEDKYELPAVMWEQAISKAPNKKNMEKLCEHYPSAVVDYFLTLLTNQKEEIALVMQRRHENIVAQMRKELRKEGDRGKKALEEVQQQYDIAKGVLNLVREAYQKKLEADIKNKELLTTESAEHTKLYEQMQAAILDTQKGVEEEAARGRELAAQINAVNEQTETMQQVTFESVKKTEEENMNIMKNIRRLNNAIKQYESRIRQIQEVQGENQNSFF